MGGVWTLAGALPIFNKINYRRGCFMKKSFQRVIAPRSLSLPKGRLIAIFLLAAFFALSACDDSSSASSDETGTSSSSVETSDSEESSSSVDKKSSGNEDIEKDKSSSSKKTASSSSALSSDSKNSSSGDKSGSSSSQAYRRCQEGTLDTLYEETRTVYKHCENDMWRTDSIVKIVIEQPKVYPNMDSVFGTLATFGTYTDQRDDKIYKTVKYRSAVSNDSFTVMAQNLNYAEMTIDSITTVFDDSKVEKRCYKDDPWYCDNYFGARYTWSEAMGLPKVCDSVGVAENPKCNIDLSKKVQGVCPTGWHVMTETEWKHMATSDGYSAVWSVLSKAVWNYELVSEVQNSRGLSVLPKGDEYPSNQLASFWLPKEASETSGGSIHLALKDVEIGKDMKIGFFNIRCVQDEGDSF